MLFVYVGMCVRVRCGCERCVGMCVLGCRVSVVCVYVCVRVSCERCVCMCVLGCTCVLGCVLGCDLSRAAQWSSTRCLSVDRSVSVVVVLPAFSR